MAPPGRRKASSLLVAGIAEALQAIHAAGNRPTATLTPSKRDPRRRRPARHRLRHRPGRRRARPEPAAASGSARPRFMAPEQGPWPANYATGRCVRARLAGHIRGRRTSPLRAGAPALRGAIPGAQRGTGPGRLSTGPAATNSAPASPKTRRCGRSPVRSSTTCRAPDRPTARLAFRAVVAAGGSVGCRGRGPSPRSSPASGADCTMRRRGSRRFPGDGSYSGSGSEGEGHLLRRGTRTPGGVRPGMASCPGRRSRRGPPGDGSTPRGAAAGARGRRTRSARRPPARWPEDRRSCSRPGYLSRRERHLLAVRPGDDQPRTPRTPRTPIKEPWSAGPSPPPLVAAAGRRLSPLLPHLTSPEAGDHRPRARRRPTAREVLPVRGAIARLPRKGALVASPLPGPDLSPSAAPAAAGFPGVPGTSDKTAIRGQPVPRPPPSGPGGLRRDLERHREPSPGRRPLAGRSSWFIPGRRPGRQLQRSVARLLGAPWLCRRPRDANMTAMARDDQHRLPGLRGQGAAVPDAGLARMG